AERFRRRPDALRASHVEHESDTRRRNVMKIREIMSSEVVTVSTDASLKEVAEILAERRISGLPVVDDDGLVVGVVSEADILFKERGPSSRGGVFAWLLDPGAVRVTVENGKVTLDGVVDNESDAELVNVFVAKVPGVVEVESSLRWTANGVRS